MMQAQAMTVGQNAKDSPRIIAEATIAHAITTNGLGTGCRVHNGERNNEAESEQRYARDPARLEYRFVWLHHPSPFPVTIHNLGVEVNG